VDRLFRLVGIGFGFAVNGDLSGSERMIALEMVSRIIARGEWQTLEAGLRQRVLDLLIHDVYHGRNIVFRARFPRAANGRGTGRRQGPVRRRRSSRPDRLSQRIGTRRAWFVERVALANAMGAGIADHKSIYPYVPEMIEFYLGEKPILNNVSVFQCRNLADLAYALSTCPTFVEARVALREGSRVVDSSQGGRTKDTWMVD
jgi:uncharacterized circularly permuted ATP-grasp superfamily protein